MGNLEIVWSPDRWGVRVRSALTAAGVVAVVVLLGAVVVVSLLYRSLYGSVDSPALARLSEITDQLHTTAPGGLNPALLSATSHIEAVQIFDATGALVRSSAGAPGRPLVTVPGSGAVTGLSADGPADLRVSARTVHGPAGVFTVLAAVSAEPAEDALKDVALGLALSGPIVVLAAAAATYALVGRSLASVEAIRARVADIGASELSQRVPVPLARDEIARLATTMNEMLTRIETGHTAQRRFLADASHELRSPLATLVAGLELAHHHPDTADDSLIGATLLPEAVRMQKLIADLLTLATADDHGLTLHATDVDLDDIAATVVAAVRHTCMAVAVTAQLQPVRIDGDPQALTRVVRNLLDNAVTHARSMVTVTLTATDTTARVVIDDDGPGIPDADRLRVFDRFVRLQDDRGRSSGGTGLGLAIVAEIVTAHHGTVDIGRSPLGGARLSVDLPLHPPPAEILS
ncbi:sensor histidine kinase [Nocardia jiangxiensis]|uniref:histidine kinase n=1 Tax=Nocardia jiangxiensis TaxID=282685 RepID=A0ABW6S3S9_9NOCA|nr:HAMP domain-containing sensor histidine kinase [Nocardia jiangxiensis]